jgi:nucleoside-diphosphate-sugar epimerase
LNKTIAILGCGWLGLPLAASLIEDGFIVKGSTTRQSKFPLLEKTGVVPLLIRLTETGVKGNLPRLLRDADTLVVAIPPRLRKDPEANFVAKIKYLINAVNQSTVKHLIFISSTSVYGNLEGTVTEATNPVPQTESGKQLLECENLLKASNTFKTTIIRFAGLIGEDRHPATFLSGKCGIKHPHAFVNLIHQEDCIGIIKAILNKKPLNKIYNAAYPAHPSKKEYYTAEALKKGLTPPEFEPSGFTGKLIASDLLISELSYQFKKPINL